jgi:hypothetical protein
MTVTPTIDEVVADIDRLIRALNSIDDPPIARGSTLAALIRWRLECPDRNEEIIPNVCPREIVELPDGRAFVVHGFGSVSLEPYVIARGEFTRVTDLL